MAEVLDQIDVVLSTDIGCEIDDQWTVAYLLTHPRFRVRALLSVHAPVFRPPAGAVALQVLKAAVARLGLESSPPMLEGASGPLTDRHSPIETDAVRFLVEVSREYSPERRLHVFAIGAPTDVASALLLDPSIEDRICVTQMAFWSWEKGATDYNVQNDPDAERVLLASNTPIIAGCIEVCRRDLAMHLEQARELLAPLGEVGEWLWVEFQDYYYRRILPIRSADFSKPWVIWDNVVLAYHLGMTTHSERPRPQIAADGAFEFPDDGRTIQWIDSIDGAALWADFAVRIQSNEAKRLKNGSS